MLDDDILLLNLTTRAKNCLLSEEIYTIKQLLKISSKSLLKIPNMGKESYFEVNDSLKLYLMSKLGINNEIEDQLELKKKVLELMGHSICLLTKEIKELKALIICNNSLLSKDKMS